MPDQATFDLVIRNGTVVDGTGAPAFRADVAIVGDRIVAIAPHLTVRGRREIDATDRIVTPGFVDIHTHLDAQIAWDPIGSSSCYHGVTSVVMGNCGVTFAPCKPEDRGHLAMLMEAVEDIPRDAILDGMPWDWVTFGEYLASVERMPKGPNVGGLVGHSALRHWVMGERGLDPAPATADDIAAMAELLDEAMRGGALGFSTNRTAQHKVPDGRPIPGTLATPDELYAFADVLGRHGVGVFESAGGLAERDVHDEPGEPELHFELGWMGEVSRRSGRPVTFGMHQHSHRPTWYRTILQAATAENERVVDGRRALVRPQTSARFVGMLHRGHHGSEMPAVDVDRLFVLNPLSPGEGARYDLDPSRSIGAIARARGVSASVAYDELVGLTDGALVCTYPFLNTRLDALAEMIDDPNLVVGLADAGAHVGEVLDASQPTWFLAYWIRERARWTIEEGVRRLTSDTADLFGIADRGRLTVGAFADVNVIDLESLGMPAPTFVHDFPNGAGRWVQGASGYDCTIVNGEVFMEHGLHTGALPGRLLRPTPHP